MFRQSFLTLLAVLAAAVPATASAASWQNVTGDTHSSLTAVSAARSTATGALHVVWAGPGSDPNNRNVLYVRDVLASGKLGPQRTITMATGSGGLTNPSIARNPADGSFWVFNAGVSTLTGRLFATRSTDDTATWSAPVAISTSEYAYAPDNSSAAFASDGSAYQTFGVHFKRTLGVDASEDDLANAPGFDAGFDNGCCAYWSQVAVDTLTMKPYVAWFLNLRDGRDGIEVVSPNDGTVTYAPGSADAGRKNSANGDQPTSITGRMNAGGVYLGYCGGYTPSCTTALVWRYGTPKPTLVGTGKGLQHVRVAAAPGGRLWAYWEHKGWIFARRSNSLATVWGEPVKLKLPGTEPFVWRLAGDGSAGYLDVLASLKTGAVHATWTNRIKPGLTLAAPMKAKVGAKVTFKVTDAGLPVPGAKVAFRGMSATTNIAGAVSFTVSGKAGKAVATATRGGFTADVAALTVTM